METKICTICGVEKDINMFHWRNKSLNTKRSECKECHNDKVKEKYQNNKKILHSLKSGKKCIKCGYDKCVNALDFHHIDESNKIANVSDLAVHYNIDSAIEESKKCVLLCANCHREFHYMEYNYNMTIQEFLHK